MSHEIKPKIDVLEKCTLPEVQKNMYTEVLMSSKKVWSQRNAESAENAKKGLHIITGREERS